MEIAWSRALENTRANRENCRFPESGDGRSIAGKLFPALKPRFQLKPGGKIFTIGSCFARNIEEKLSDFIVPTLSFKVPKDEWAFRPNGLLNEYNPGTIAQRIQSAFGLYNLHDDTVVDIAEGAADLLLPGGVPVKRERVFERRREISSIYSELPTSDVAIITLGLVEAWYDTATATYLNRMPPPQVARANQSRYTLRVMDVFESLPLLDDAIGAIATKGINVLLTVSPVPLQTTFSGQDAVVANSFSKSVLRVCAQRLCAKYTNVDYFPSYEIVLSGGLASFLPDQIHVLDRVVKEATEYMIQAYTAPVA